MEQSKIKHMLNILVWGDNIIINKKGESKSNNGMKVEERSVVPCFRLIVSDAGKMWYYRSCWC